MSTDARLAEIAGKLELAGVPYLVMGGHAVRFYGLNRDTSDFDLYLAAEEWDNHAERLAATPLAGAGPLAEGPSWRPGAFKLFQTGRLNDGREEWLEFWRGNHLLEPFPALYTRRNTLSG